MIETILNLTSVISAIFSFVFFVYSLYKKDEEIAALQRKNQRMREFLFEKMWDADYYKEKTQILQEDLESVEKKYREELQDLREELMFARLRNTLGNL